MRQDIGCAAVDILFKYIAKLKAKKFMAKLVSAKTVLPGRFGREDLKYVYSYLAPNKHGLPLKCKSVLAYPVF